VIQGDYEAGEKSQRLQEFRALLANAAWQEEFAPQLLAAYAAHLEGSTQRGKSPQERAEHIEAFHLAAELESFCRRRVDLLEKELRDYSRRAAAVDARVADAL
jgi:hypothetical protein